MSGTRLPLSGYLSGVRGGALPSHPAPLRRVRDRWSLSVDRRALQLGSRRVRDSLHHPVRLPQRRVHLRHRCRVLRRMQRGCRLHRRPFLPSLSVHAMRRLEPRSLGRPDHDRRASHLPREKPARPARAASQHGFDARLFGRRLFRHDSEEIEETCAFACEETAAERQALSARWILVPSGSINRSSVEAFETSSPTSWPSFRLAVSTRISMFVGSPRHEST